VFAVSSSTSSRRARTPQAECRYSDYIDFEELRPGPPLLWYGYGLLNGLNWAGMHIRAKCCTSNCVAYGIENTIVVDQLENLKTIENELTCQLCNQPMKIIKASVDDDKN
jgi:hypothetical protein